MDLKKLLSVNIATLAALGALLLAMGQSSPWAPLVVWMAGVLSVVVTDFTGWFRLNRNLAVVAAMAVMFFYLRQFLNLDSAARTLVLAELLVWLQVILLFQEKDERVYWWLAVMSMLQVVVAAGINEGVGFGLLLVVYMLTGLSAMTLLFLFSQENRYRAKEETVRSAQAAEAGAAKEAHATNDGSSRWPLAAGRPEFSSSPAGSSRAGIVRELFARLGVLGVGTLFLALVMFFTVPRLGQPAWRVAVTAPRSVVGFSDHVRLGELGPILEDRAEVMRVTLTYGDPPRPYPIQDELYFRGTVVTRYEKNQWSRGGKRGAGRGASSVGQATWDAGRGDADHGEWRVASRSDMEDESTGEDEAQHDSPPRPSVLPHFRFTPDPHPTADARVRASVADLSALPPAVRQHIEVQPLDRDELFSLWPFVKPAPSNPELYYDWDNERLLRQSRYHGRRFAFKLDTTAMADGAQARLVPCDGPVNVVPLKQLPDNVPRLAALAKEWLAASGLPAGDDQQRAEWLERQLAESGRFQYSLEGQPRDPTIDAIEDFVANHPRGHCEYFATALALMLRSQGIPSRVVLGYRCDEWNPVGKFYQVRQLHAHAWVEAYLEPQQVPRPLLQGDGEWDRWQYGGWLRLDGTPAAAIGTTAADSSAWGRWQSQVHKLQSLWENYVVEMDRQRQKEAVIQPLFGAIRGAARNLADPQWWRETFRRLADALRISSWNGIGGWLLGVATPLLAVLLVLAGLGWGAWRAARRLWQRWLRGAAAKTTRSTIEFYRRLEALLARRGLLRAPGETPREFALAAGARLAGQCGREELAALPVAVVDAFYRVRFGGRPLEAAQADDVERALAELEEAQRAAGRPVPGRPSRC
jgi:protein-glutamine gamma-glutamyltransferase